MIIGFTVILATVMTSLTGVVMTHMDVGRLEFDGKPGCANTALPLGILGSWTTTCALRTCWHIWCGEALAHRRWAVRQAVGGLTILTSALSASIGSRVSCRL